MTDMPSQSDGPNFSDVPIEVTISIGRTHPTVRELLDLNENAILVLDKNIQDPVDIFVGDKLIARGELQELEDTNISQLAVRLTEIIDPPSGSRK